VKCLSIMIYNKDRLIFCWWWSFPWLSITLHKIPWLSRPGKLKSKIAWLSRPGKLKKQNYTTFQVFRTCTNPVVLRPSNLLAEQRQAKIICSEKPVHLCLTWLAASRTMENYACKFTNKWHISKIPTCCNLAWHLWNITSPFAQLIWI